jgi:hypothetical protein
MEVEVLRDQPGDGEAEPRADGDRDRQRGDGAALRGAGQVLAGKRDAQRHRPVPDALQGAPGEQLRERRRRRRDHRAGEDGAQRAEQDALAPRAVAQAPDHRSGHDADEQRQREHPLRRLQRHVLVGGDGGDERRPEGGLHGDRHPGEHERRREDPGARLVSAR